MRIAAVQCSPVFDDALRVGEDVAQRLRWADRQGVDLTVLPEAFLLGHSYDRETIHARAAASAAVLSDLCERVASCRSTLVVGTFDRVGEQVFNSAIVIESGQVIGRYAKAHPNEPAVTAGTAFPTFLRSGMRYGINICNDANHPAAAQRIADQDADLILYPLNNMLPSATADRWRARSLANLIDRAPQTGCWVASADVAGASGSLVSYGCTAIVSPQGTVVARVPEGREGVAIFDLPPRQARPSLPRACQPPRQARAPYRVGTGSAPE
jgi:predicted amidohydrolase